MASRLPGAAPEPIATTKRKRLTPLQRLALYEAFGGVCALCRAPLDGSKSDWIDEHGRALGLGGTNDLDNRAPVHRKCAGEKTVDDNARIKKAKRQKSVHVGAKEPSGRWPARSKPEKRRRAPAPGQSEFARRMQDKPKG